MHTEAVHKVRHAGNVGNCLYCGLILTPSPVTLCHTFRDPQLNIEGGPRCVTYCHTSRTPPMFSRPSTKNPDKSPCTNSFSLVSGIPGVLFGVLSGGLCLEGFVRGGFVRSPFCHNTCVTTES